MGAGAAGAAPDWMYRGMGSEARVYITCEEPSVYSYSEFRRPAFSTWWTGTLWAGGIYPTRGDSLYLLGAECGNR